MKLLAYLVHGFTAAGAFAGLLALERAYVADYTWMFYWLALALFIDGVDGTLARRFKVRETLPYIDGDVLDAVVDYLTYVVVPLVAVWTSGMLPPMVAMYVVGFAGAASALYFADTRMKTSDNWFRGFPALWNVVVLYLFAFTSVLPDWLVALLILVCCAAMFVPVVFVHPMRVKQMRFVTLAVVFVWFCAGAWLVVTGFSDSVFARSALALSGLYFLALPLWRATVWAEPPAGA